MKRGLQLHYRITLLLFVFAFIVSGAMAAILFQAASNRVMEDIRLRLQDIASVAAHSIDISAHDRLVSPEQEGNADYMLVKNALKKSRDAASDIHFIYTMRTAPDGAISFVVDAEDNPDAIAHLGEVYDDPSAMLNKVFANLSSTVVEENTYTDEWGTWLSGYAPFFRADGSRAGVLGIDISASTIMEYRRTLMWRATIMFCSILPLILLGGYLLGRRLALPIVQMKAGAERFAQGNLDTHINLNRTDELGVLAQTLDDMADNIKLGREHLNEMVEQYRSIFDNAVEGIFQCSVEGRFLTANTALIQMLGYESLDDLQSGISDIRSQLYAIPKDRDMVIEQLHQRANIQGLITQFKRKNGSLVWVEISAHVQQGKHEGVIEGMVQDISERLERETAERERRSAEAASQAKSEFLANMSHEIRTPLNAVMGMADLLRRTELTDKQREYLRKIHISSKSLLAVINDILDFSKIEAGRLELEQTNFSLYEIMANISEMFVQAAHEKDLELAVSIDPDIPTALVGDPVRLSQILINLTGNAIKFTSQGEVVVSVCQVEQSASETGSVTLKFIVRDTGVGIAANRVDAIFDSFSQEDTSTTRKHGGTGLGLAICKQLSRLMGGNIRVESTQGEGSKFSFTAVFEAQAEENQPRPTPPRDLRGLRVLIVDDNATSREILSSSIASFMMEAVTATSGEHALEIIQSNPEPFDLILMDWKMPGLNGMETARKIKHELQLDKLPIICMISAYGREDLLQQTEKTVLDAFLHKPVNQSLLFDSIMGLFGRQSDFTSAVTNDEVLSTEEACMPERLAGAHVLLVEDNTINQEVAKEWLESGNLHVTIAENGRVALEYLEADSFDVTLMDIQMPEMDGLEATRRIRQDSRFDRMPVIGMTAHALKGDRERGIDAGMDDYITKPIDPRKLFSTLDKWVKDVQQGQAAQSISTKDEKPESSNEPDFTNLNIPGLFVETGLYRANNKPGLYLKLLKTFVKDFSTAETEIIHYVNKADFDQAKRLAHSIKGVSGNIGAMRLSEAAAAVENDAAQSILDMGSQHWIDFIDALQLIITGLERDLPEMNAANDAAISSNTPSGGESILCGSELLEPLQALRTALDDDLPAARDMLETLKPSLAPLIGQNAVESMVEGIDEFDIDSVDEALGKAIEQIEE